VGDFSCDLSPLERETSVTPDPEATPDPESELPPGVPVYTLSSNCDGVAPRLRMVLEGTLWLGVSAPSERDWLPTEQVGTIFAGDVDPYPPQLDRRGRWFGCVGYELGDYTWRVLVGLDDAWHLIAVPVTVLEPGYPPAPTVPPTSRS
jgi:hypothetical protein